MDKQNVYKIATNFGGTPVYDAFLRHGIVFIGCETPGWAAVMRGIREGDIVVIAAGYAIVAVAEIRTPAAEIHQYQLAPDDLWDKLDREYGVPIMACRADIYPLDEQDCLLYEFRPRECQVGKQEIRDAAIDLLAKYKKQQQGGIFSWATGELSQDATLCWLFDSLKARGKYSPIARDLLNKMGVPEQARVCDMQVFRQCYHIDLILHFKQDGEDKVLIVEDKINASLYNDIQGYIGSVVEYGLPDGFKPQREQVSACVVRTGDGNECNAVPQGIVHVTRRDVMDTLERNREAVRGSEILQGFYEKLQEWETAYQGYKLPEAPERVNRANLEQDVRAAWKGLYDYLLDKGLLTQWMYVPNQNGGFMCGVVSPPQQTRHGHDLYMQFDSSSGRLCMKVGQVYEKHKEVRDEVVAKFFEYASSSGEFASVVEKTKAAYGCYMTYAAIPISAWLQDTLEETEAYLRRVNEWYLGFARSMATPSE